MNVPLAHVHPAVTVTWVVVGVALVASPADNRSP